MPRGSYPEPQPPKATGTFGQLPSFPHGAGYPDLAKRQQGPAHPIAPREPGFCFDGKKMPANYYAYHVDLHGVALASYELQGADDSVAVSEARSLLRFHPSLEVWQGARFVARLKLEQSGSAKAT
jgi:hypothetical protein